MLSRHQAQPSQQPQATVPPHPILDVEPVNPVGTPVPFYPIPQQQPQQHQQQPQQTPIPFYPGPMQPVQPASHQPQNQPQIIPVNQPSLQPKQKSVSFAEEEEKIQKIMSGGEECQNACSISKILQK
jgi:hypothetical protein